MIIRGIVAFIMIAVAFAQELAVFPREAAWPKKVKLVQATTLIGAEGSVTMTKPVGTEMDVLLCPDHATVVVSLKDPDLRQTVPIYATDFMKQATEAEARMIEADHQAELKIAEEKAAEQKRLTDQFDASYGEAVNERAIYGPEPFWSDNGISSPSVPTIVQRNLKRTLKDPDSLIVKSVTHPVHADYNGVKCWRLNFVFSSRNSFGGMGSAKCVAWLRNGDLLNLTVVGD
jgi:hypothetical protein